MINSFLNSTSRPNRLTDTKDELYHTKYARWAVSQSNNRLYREFIGKCALNWSFYKGGAGQWVLSEDLEGFFMDDTGELRNRIRMSENMIKPIVQQFVGNAIRMDFNAQAEGINNGAISKMTEELNRMQFFHQAEQANPELSGTIRDRIPLGNSFAETEEMVRANPQDAVQDNANALLRAIIKDVDSEELKVRLAKYLALSGMCIYKGEEYNGRYEGDVVIPWQFFWDTSARRPDLTDAAFMGEWGFSDSPVLFEKYPGLNAKERDAIEQYVVDGSLKVHEKIFNNTWNVSSAQVPVYKTYWKDMFEAKYAWIRDKHDYLCYERIDDDSTQYKTSDRVPKSQLSENQVEQTRGKLEEKIYVDELRFCELVPREDVSTNGLDNDVVLEYGTVKYQEKYNHLPDSVNYPYKVQTWSYENGEVLTPIDDALDPQRMTNRMLSIQESHINNAHGSGAIIARESVDENEAELISDMNRSKPIVIEAAWAGGVQNAVGDYKSNLGQDSASIEGVRQQMKTAIADMTGINDAMTGTMGSQGSLVGVVNQQIQRGTIIQEPFYYSLTKCLTASFQHMITVGKKVYADNPRRLAQMVGDRGKDILVFLRDIELEDFRLSVERVEGEKTQSDQGAEAAFMFLQYQMLSPTIVAALLKSKATLDMVYDAAAKYTTEKEMAEKQQAQNMQQGAESQANIEQSQIQAGQVMEEEQLSMDQDNKQADRMSEYLKSSERNEASLERDRMKLAANA